jgi:hypothetical protein
MSAQSDVEAQSENDILIRFTEEGREKVSCRLITKQLRAKSRGWSGHISIDNSQVRESDYAPLYIAMANESTRVIQRSMASFISRNDRQTAWEYIAEGYRRCPFLILNKAFELNDSTIPRPLLVRIAKKVQKRCAYSCSTISELTDESLNEHDTLVLRWWLAYIQLDAQNWQSAEITLELVVEDCDQGRWPSYFLPEALYMLAIVYFYTNKCKLCAGILGRYFIAAHILDRNMADATLLSLWAKQPIPSLSSISMLIIEDVGTNEEKQMVACMKDNMSVPIDQQSTDLRSIDNKLSAAWDEDTFTNHSKVRVNVAAILRVETYEHKSYEAMCASILKQWTKFPQSQEKVNAEKVAEEIRTGGRYVTVRFHEREEAEL